MTETGIAPHVPHSLRAGRTRPHDHSRAGPVCGAQPAPDEAPTTGETSPWDVVMAWIRREDLSRSCAAVETRTADGRRKVPLAHPIFQPQPLDPAKLPSVAGDQHQILAECMRRNPEVVIADGLSHLFQFCTDSPVVPPRNLWYLQNPNPGSKLAEILERFVPRLAFFRTVHQFSECHDRHAHVGCSVLSETCPHLRRMMLGDIDTDMGIQKVSHPTSQPFALLRDSILPALFQEIIGQTGQ
jgi:hypothetical protein